MTVGWCAGGDEQLLLDVGEQLELEPFADAGELTAAGVTATWIAGRGRRVAGALAIAQGYPQADTARRWQLTNRRRMGAGVLGEPRGDVDALVPADHDLTATGIQRGA